ncbi:MAG TPA: threonine synthase, partial [Acidimicrobiia bacterium]|nr:threonine synthase [Acidimicrobiia bacterium]
TNLPQVVVATAHPAKFSETIRASLGQSPEWPEIHDELFQLPERIEVIEPDTSELERLIR